MNFFKFRIIIWTQKRDKERVKRLTDKGISWLEILRAGIKVWEDRKQLNPIHIGN